MQPPTSSPRSWNARTPRRLGEERGFELSRRGQVLWREQEIARLEAGEDRVKPVVVIVADEHLSGPDKEKVQGRLNAWIVEQIAEQLKPLIEIDRAQDIAGLARGIAFRLKENFGVFQRESIAEEIRSLDQPARSQLRKDGVRFGAFNIFFPVMLEACLGGIGIESLVFEATEPSTGWISPPCPSCRARPDIAGGSGHGTGSLLPRGWLPCLQASRGPSRHAGAARGPPRAA